MRLSSVEGCMPGSDPQSQDAERGSRTPHPCWPEETLGTVPAVKGSGIG